MEQIVNVVTIVGIILSFIIFISNDKINDFFINKEILFIKKKRKVGSICIKFFILMFYILLIIICIVSLIDNLLKYFNKDVEKIKQNISEYREKIQIESEVYDEIMSKTYNIENCQNPYEIEGFEYVEGTWDNGYVIEDSQGNQFVWVPCTNEENELGIEILKKNNFSNDAFIKSFDCNEENYEEFLRSALENGGFYISRFEIGKDEDGNPVSKESHEIWTNITRDRAMKLATNMYNNINSELINGYAYDTTFSWIINTENVKAQIKNDDKYTGTQCYKNIYDIVDNIYEITTEDCYGVIIYRGIIPDTKYMTTTEFDNRLSGSTNYKYENLGFRTILYK